MYSDLDALLAALGHAGRVRERPTSGALATATATGTRVTGRPRSVSGDRVAVPVRVRRACSAQLSLDFEAAGRRTRRRRARAPGRARSTFPGLRAGRGAQPPARRCHGGRRCSRATARCSPKARPDRRRQRARRSAQLAAGRSGGRAWSGPSARSRPPRGGQLEAKACRRTRLVGLSGLELALDARLRGTPGGELLAGQPGAGERLPPPRGVRRTVRTTISPGCSAPP